MAASQSEVRPRYKRSAKNYLLDPHFQLKYTGFLVGITVALSGVLGALLWRASDEVLAQARDTVQQNQVTVRQGQATVNQSEETVERGKKTLALSDTLNKLVVTTIEGCYADNPGLLESYKTDSAKTDEGLAKDQARLEEDKRKIEEQKAALDTQAQKVESDVRTLTTRIGQMRVGFAGVLIALVLAIGVAGIVFTHKIAGPVFKMKRLFRQIGDGKLALHEKLRKGDELQHFFEAFEKMVEGMRTKQQQEIDEIDGVLATLDKDGLNDSAAAKALRALRGEMRQHLEG